jgi:hypothetical protein
MSLRQQLAQLFNKCQRMVQKTAVEAVNSLKHFEVLTIQQRLDALIAQSTANNPLLRNGFKVFSQHVEDRRLVIICTTPAKARVDGWPRRTNLKLSQR